VFQQLKDIKDIVYRMDPSMMRSVKFGRELDVAAETYRDIFDKMKQNKHQMEVTVF